MKFPNPDGQAEATEPVGAAAAPVTGGPTSYSGTGTLVPDRAWSLAPGEEPNLPGDPLGLTQVKEAIRAKQLDPWQMPTGSYVDVAQRWYTGANSEGMQNGYDTEFFREGSKQFGQYYDEAGKKNDPSILFNWLDVDPGSPGYNPNATGMARYDDPTAYGRGDGKGIRATDLFLHGKWVGNYRERYADDPYTADVLAAEWLLEQPEKARVFNSYNRVELLHQMVQEKLDANTRFMADIRTYQQQKDEIQRTQGEVLDDPTWQFWNTVIPAMATGGMAAGAAASPVLFGGPAGWLGTGAAFLGGAAYGGTMAWLNRDNVTNIEARAMAIVNESRKQYGATDSWVHDASVVSHEWGQVLMTSINPLQNTVQGITDAVVTAPGDGIEGYYDINPETGERYVGPLVQGINLAAMFGDSLIQFTNPVGATIYIGTTAAMTAGGVGQLATTQSGYNEWSGKFEDYEGAAEWTGAIVDVGIDAVQVFTGAGLMSLGRKGRALLGPDSTTAGLSRGTRSVTEAGMRYRVDQYGKAVGRRWFSIQMFAPSEIVHAVVVGQRARNMARAAGVTGKLSADDYYRAAREIVDASRYTAAMTSAVGEATEELVQAIMEPMSFTESIDPYSVAYAALSGAAAGAGMSAGSTAGRRAGAPKGRQERRDSNIAHGMAEVAEDREIPDDEWDERWGTMTPGQKRRAPIIAQKAAEQQNATVAMINDGMVAEMGALSPVGIEAWNNILEEDMLTALRDANPEATGYYQLQARPSHRMTSKSGLQQQVYGENAGLMSMYEVMTFLRHNNVLSKRDIRNLEMVTARYAQLLTDAQAKLGEIDQRVARGEQGLEDTRLEIDNEVKHAQRLVDAAKARAIDITYDKSMSDLVYDLLQKMMVEYHDINIDQVALRHAKIDDINALIVSMAEYKWTPQGVKKMSQEQRESVRRAVEGIIYRDPRLGLSGYDLIIPQVSYELTDSGANRIIQLSSQVFKPKHADTDGDAIATMRSSYILPSYRQQLRQGLQFFEAASSHNEQDDEGHQVPFTQTRESLGDVAALSLTEAANEAGIVKSVARALNSADPAFQTAAEQVLEALHTELYDRYVKAKSRTGKGVVSKPPIKAKVFREAWAQFELDLRSEIPEARAKFMDAVVQSNPIGILEMGEETFRRETVHMMSRIFDMYDSMTTQRAMQDSAEQTMVTPTGRVLPIPAREGQVDHQVRQAKTAGQTWQIIGASQMERRSGHQHFTIFHSAVQMDPGLEHAGMTDLEWTLTEDYERLSGNTESEMDLIQNKFSLEDRIIVWLQKLVDLTDMDPNDVNSLLIMAQAKVGDVGYDKSGNLVELKGKTTVLQLFMKRSLEIEARRYEGKPETDPVWNKLRRLRGLTNEKGPHSATAFELIPEVFGAYSLADLAGQAADYIGPHFTMNQMDQLLMSQDLTNRRRLAMRWTGVPGYVKDASVKDPPYSREDIQDGKINALAILVDAVIAKANVSEKHRNAIDAANSAKFEAGFKDVIRGIEAWHEANAKRHSTEDIEGRLAWLDDMVTHQQDWSRALRLSVDSKAHRAMFHPWKGEITYPRWFRRALAMTDPKLAEVEMFRFSQFALFNAAQGTVGIAKDDKPTLAADGKVRISDLPSQFLQMMLSVAEADPTRFEFYAMVEVVMNASSMEDLRELVNAHPNWLKNKAPWHPYTNDPSAYAASTSQLFGGISSDAKRSEELEKFASAARASAQGLVARAKTMTDESILLNRIADHMDNGTNVGGAKVHAKHLTAALERAELYPDGTGPAVMMELYQEVGSRLSKFHAKAEPDEAIANAGLPVAMITAFGLGTDIEQEMTALTANDPANVRSNPTRLRRTPVEVNNADGTTTLVDMRDDRAVLTALQNPRLRSLALSVIEPTVRDIDGSGAVVMYADRTEDDRELSVTLERTAKFTDVFDENIPQVQRNLRFTSVLEAGLRQESLTMSLDQQDAMNYPISRVFMDFFNVYKTSIKGERMADTALIQHIVRNVPEALQELASIPEALLPQAQMELEMMILEQWGDPMAAFHLHTSDAAKVFMDVEWINAIASRYADRKRDYMQQLQEIGVELAGLQKINPSDPKIPQLKVDLDFLKRRIEILDESVNHLATRNPILPRRLFGSWEGILNKYTLTGDPVVDLKRKEQIARWLLTGNQINRFDGKKSMPLVRELQTSWADSQERPAILANNNFTIAMWNELGAMAAALEIEGMDAQPASWTSALPLNTNTNDPKSLNRYFDTSFASTMAPLFDPMILGGTRRMMHASSVNRYKDYGYLTAINNVFKLLYPPDLVLGNWNNTVVKQAAWIQQAFAISSVKITVPIGGDMINRMSEAIAAGMATEGEVLPEHYTTADETFVLTPGQSPAIDLLSRFPVLELENHYIKSIEITPLDGSVPPAKVQDFNLNAGAPVLSASGVDLKGHTLYSTNRIAMMIEALRAKPYNMKSFSLKIEYVNVNKKPHTPEHVNNPLFDGMGRDGIVGGYASPMAAMLFGLGAIANVTQQKPLDMLTRAGQAFRGYLTSKYDTVKQLETGTISEQINKKTMHFWEKKYTSGFLLYGDLPAAYKWMKSRHVVIGFNPETNREERWWAERYITAEYAQVPGATNNPNILQNPRLVKLSERTYRRLVGTIDGSSAAGEVSIPNLPVQEVNVFPLLTDERLARLKLNIGAVTPLADSDMRHQAQLPTLRWRPPREATYSPINPRSESWRRRRNEFRLSRDGTDATWSPRRMEATNKHTRTLLEQLVAQTKSMYNLNNAMVPDLAIGMDWDMAQVLNYVHELQVNPPPNSITWIFKHDAKPDPLLGEFNLQDVEGGFAALGDRGPVYEDQGVLHLPSFWFAANGKPEDALKLAIPYITTMAERGLTIILGTDTPVPEFQAMVAQFLMSGRVGPGYKSLIGTTVFVPREAADDKTQAEESINSTRLATQHGTRAGWTVRVLHDMYGTRSLENTVFVDPRNDPRYLMTGFDALPGRLTYADGTMNKFYAFNDPAGLNPPTSEQAVLKKMRTLLEDQKYVDFFLEQLGPDPDMPIYHEWPDGQVDPGILSKEAAMALMKAEVDAGIVPGSVGSTLWTGGFKLSVTNNGTIMVIRRGFYPPEPHQIREQLEKNPKGMEGAAPHGVAVSTNRYNTNWTVGPPMVVKDVHVDQATGMRVTGDYVAHYLSKWISAGFKAANAPIPETSQFPTDVPIGIQADDPLLETEFASFQEGDSKQTTYHGLVNNWRNVFQLAGYDNRLALLHFFGRDVDKLTDEELDLEWDSVKDILHPYAQLTHFSHESISQAIQVNRHAMVIQETLNTIQNEIDPLNTEERFDFADKPEPVDDVRDFIARIVLAVLAIDGVTLADVAYSKGLFEVEGDEEWTLIADELATALAVTDNPDVSEYLREEINTRMYKAGRDGKPVRYLNGDWTWDRQYEDRLTGEPLLYKVMYQTIAPFPAKENTALYEQSILNRGPFASLTPHSVRMDAAALGGVLVTDRDTQRFGLYGNDNIVPFGIEGNTIGFHEMMANVSKDDPAYTRPQRRLPIEQDFINDGLDKYAAYHHVIDRAPPGKPKWTTPLPNQLWNEFAGILNLDPIRDKKEGDYLVRQFWGAPGPFKDQDDYFEQIDEHLYVKAMTFMLRNIKEFKHPLEGGIQHNESQAFWEKLFKSQHGKPKQWAPLAAEGGKLKKTQVALEWSEWIESLVTQVRHSDKTFSYAFAVDNAAFWQTFHSSASQYDITSLSMDQLRNLRMMDPDTNEFLLSLDENMNAVLAEPMLMDTVDMTLDALTGQTSRWPDVGTIAPDAMTLGDRVAHIEAWFAKKGKGKKQKGQSFKSYVREGQLYINSDREMAQFASVGIHLQIINRLFMPILWVAAYIDVPFRSAFQTASDVGMGRHTGIGSRWIARRVEARGYTPAFGEDVIDGIKAVAPSIGSSNEILGDVFKEYTKRYSANGTGKIANWLGRLAGNVSLWFADPRRGMRDSTIGRLYMNGVLDYLHDTNSSVDIKQLVYYLGRDADYLLKEAKNGRPGAFSAHRAGINRVAQNRGFRATLTGKSIMAPLRSMLGSSHIMAQGAGVLLFVPFAFTAFAANFLVMIAGAQILDQGLARLLDDRMNWLSRLTGFIEGDNYDPERSERFDMSDVVDGYNFSRAFIESGISWTTLFTAGMLASSMGLTGEDPEERRRRRIAERLHLPMYIDAFKPDEGSPFLVGGAEKDFRQDGMMYLDQTPIAAWYEADDHRSSMKPHWVMAQYTAPVMGMARFFETGDFRYVFGGFWDSAAVVPYTAMNLWRNAAEAFDIMSGAIEAEEINGTAEAEDRRRTLFMSTVGMLAKATIDNQFVNVLWTGADYVDRAPWLVPATNDIGQLKQDPGTGMPFAQTDSLTPEVFTDPQTGEAVATGDTYTKRPESWIEGTDSHAFAENSFSWMLLGSLLTGQWDVQDSSFNRHNMVPRGRDIPLKPAPTPTVESVIYATFVGEGGQPNFTEGEIVRVLKDQYEKADVEWDQEVLEAKASEIAKLHTKGGALSVLSNGVETLTQAGMDGVLTGLMKGSTKLDHPSLQGVWATRETLAKIEAEWMTRMEAESLAYGLTKAEAGYRWRRFWWGDPDDPESPGMKYIFDQIPREPDAHYTQLNVTFAMGPDGRPWATPIQRNSPLQAFIPVPSRKVSLGKGMTMDARANAVDTVLGINTGLNALVKTPITIEREKDDSKKTSTTSPSAPYKYKKFPYSGGSAYGPQFSRLGPFSGGMSVRNDDIPFINMGSPYLRRADVNKERITSDRGRLKQWQ